MPLREQDRAVWIGPDEPRGVGSSGKVRSVSEDGKFAEVDWGGGSESRCRVGVEVVTARQAANRGIEPWATAFRPRPRPAKPKAPPNVLNP